MIACQVMSGVLIRDKVGLIRETDSEVLRGVAAGATSVLATGVVSILVSDG